MAKLQHPMEIAEGKESDEYVNKSLDILKSSPNYETLREKIKVLSPAQQKLALDYALKCHKQALAAKSKSAKLSEITLNPAEGEGSETKLLATSTGTTFSVVPLSKDNELVPLPSTSSAQAVTILEEKDIIDTEILEAICNNDIAKLHSLLIRFNKKASSCISAKNEQEAHPLLLWAALEDKPDVMHYLIFELQAEKKANFDIDLINFRGETALHWACLRGNMRAVHVLLEFGASISAADERGYSAIHHAAQFGHTIIIAKLLRGMAKRDLRTVDLRDSNGRTPLHWACYKHHSGTVTYLIKKGADVWAKDWEGCTALHWAALQGDIDVIQALLWEIKTAPKITKYLEETDKTGKNALQLADAKAEKFQAFSAEGVRYTKTCIALREAHKTSSKGSVPKRGFAGFGDANNAVYDESFYHHTWLSWPVISLVLGFKFFSTVLPTIYIYAPVASIFTCFLYVAEWWVWLALQVKDPGFIVGEKVDDTSKYKRFFNYLLPCYDGPRGYISAKTRRTKDEENVELLEHGKDFNMKYEEYFPPNTLPSAQVKLAQYWRELYYEILDAGVLAPVCPSCEIARPLRSKHDRFSDKCILKFDHYCPWVGCPIAQNNYTEFFLFCLFIMLITAVWVVDCYWYAVYLDESVVWHKTATQWDMLVWELPMLLPMIPAFFYGFVMVAQHAHLVSVNLTTNEMINKHKYSYLSILPNRKISNLFSRGRFKNWMECLGFEDPVKINFKEHYAHIFTGDNVREKIQQVKQAFKGPQHYEMQSGVSITTNRNLTAQDINMSKLPSAKKSE